MKFTDRARAAAATMLVCGPAAFAFVLLQSSFAGADRTPTRGAILAEAHAQRAWIRVHRSLVQRRAHHVQSAQISRSARVDVSPVLKRHFAVFRLPRAASAGTESQATLPSGIAASVATNGFVQTDVANARFVSVGSGVWVVPGSNGACLVNNDAGTSTGCLTLGGVDGGGLFQMDLSAGKPVSILGLAPDGNSSVTLAFADGTTRDVPVVDNVYEATGAGMTTVTLDSTSGAQVSFNLLN